MNNYLIRITAPHFTAGIKLYTWHCHKDNRNYNTCAPILKYMTKWDHYKIIKYCKKKKWGWQTFGIV